MSENKGVFKNLILRKEEEGNLNIGSRTNDGGIHISKYSMEKIKGLIIMLEILDGSKKVVYEISQDEYKEIFGKRLG
ncbi:MAG: hypothetical protein PF569_04315 [Candidatus Woesearchaeota archaeon]|nr:hypothetical protein [Candidatus Woesearchaeota archaeon]